MYTEIKEIELSSWSEFEQIHTKELNDKTKYRTNAPTFYRGQSDATWPLETTLERAIGPGESVVSYYSDIKDMQSQLETFTDHKWDLPSVREYSEILHGDGLIMPNSIVNYMQYLRHFGYPSPLLDWTYSPFVAAYFAFRDVTCKSKSVAIYSFYVQSYLWDIPRSSSIFEEGPIIKPIFSPSQMNKRHYLQQSAYTVCLTKIGKHVCYASHGSTEIVVKDEDDYRSGEQIVKYVIPSAERVTALNSLDAYNINAYSLIGTEESLLETMFLQSYKYREINKMFNQDYLKLD